MVDYIRAIKRPFSDFKKLLLGIILSIPIPWVSIITNNMAAGYALKCGKMASESDYEMPKWEKYGRLWLDAFGAGIITLLYLIPVGIMVFIFAKDLVLGYIEDQNALLSNYFLNPVGLIENYGISLIFIGAFAIMLSYFIPIAILNWVITSKFASAFDFKDIFRKVFNKKYFFAWIFLSIIGTIFTLVIFNLSSLDILTNNSINSSLNLFIIIIVILVISAIDFIGSVFGYTAYGNVLEEIKKNDTNQNIGNNPSSNL